MKKKCSISFCDFIEEPPTSLAFLTIGLVTLAFAIIDFSQVVGY